MSQSAKPLPNYLIERYRGWRAVRFEENRAWYQRLADEGQRPRAMVVTCCDSRIDVAPLFGAEPGDLFIVRNVANLVPPYGPDGLHHGTSAAVEYAVTALKVPHIVVMGHSNCGGVQACHHMCAGEAPQLKEKDSFIGRWMDMLVPAYEEVAARHEDRHERQRALEEAAVVTSLRNLETFPYVAAAVADGRLALHGAWMDIGAGRLHVYSPEAAAFRPIDPAA
jgi:carbonic anhydrase